MTDEDDSSERPKSGSYCAVIKRDAQTPTRASGNLMQAFDAAPFRGKRIRPTIPVSRTRAAIATGRDELLERAIQAVKN